MILPNLRQMLLHKFLDGEWMLGLLAAVQSPIVMRGRFEMADGAGQVSGLPLWRLSFGGDFTRRSRGHGCGCALGEGVVET